MMHDAWKKMQQNINIYYVCSITKHAYWPLCTLDTMVTPQVQNSCEVEEGQGPDLNFQKGDSHIYTLRLG